MSENSPFTTSLENRVSLLEAKVKELELKLSRIANLATTATPSTPPESINVPNKQISITLINKNFHQADYSAGDSGDRIDFILQFTNHLSKDIRAFTGFVIFKDLFERIILRMGITDERGIRSGVTSQWKGGMGYNQFEEQSTRLLNTGKNDLIVEFLLKQVIYTDGTREAFNE